MTPHRSVRAQVKRLDRVAGEINAWLLVIAIGLGVLDVAVMLALSLPSPAQTAAEADSAKDQIRSGAPQSGPDMIGVSR
jgi:hypothetical protein